MQNKNIYAVFSTAVLFLFFTTLTASAEVAEDSFHILGTIEGIGKHFEINDSEYLNINLDSSEDIDVRMESAPEMIVLNIRTSNETHVSNFILSGLSANTTYHKYQDGYHNYTPLTTDENGVAFFEQDISQNHIIFIQPRKSTKSIYGSAGGTCESIGNWNASSKTCTLDQDINETIEVYTDGITLDGNGHTISGSNTGTGIYASGKNIIIKNVTVTGFYYGIYLSSAKYSEVASITAKNNRNGIYLNRSNNNTVSDNTITTSISYGLGFISSGNNIVFNNTIGSGNAYGISQEHSCNYNIFENNNISNNSNTGFSSAAGSGSYITLRNNTIISNAYDGMVIGGDHHTLSGNVMSGNGFGGFNGKSNFFIFGGDLGTNNIDKSNTVEGKPIYYLKNEINKIYDSSFDIGSFYCINCDNITLKELTLSEHGAKIFLWHTNNSLVENIISLDKSTLVDMYYSSGNTVKNSDLGKIYVRYSSNNNQIYNNNFSDTYISANLSGSTGNLFNLDLPIGGNHWKKYETACQDMDNNGFCDLSFTFSSNGIDNYPWVKEFDFSAPSGYSSVMFLPGHQASRLYRKDSGSEDQLWEPTNHNEDVEQLYLNSNGESVDSEIYTRDIIDEGYGIKNIYKSFIESMDQFVADGAINEWKPIPYDWRLPLEKIAEDDVKLENGGHMNIIEEIKRMAAASKTGKVTLIGHSNGGLLAKVLINCLKNSGNEKLIDKLIMVGTPQLGTPKAIASLLHGDNANMLWGMTLDKKTGRGFAENMASAYNLLPSREYFDIVQSPIVEFDSDVKEIYDFQSLYGDNIDNWEEFKKFLLGDDGARTKPEANDLDSPNVLRETLLNEADTTHDELDSWQAPEGIEVVQIAGWGLDTIRGIEYDDCDIPFCPDKLSNLDRSLILTTDGDKTVTSPSAVAMNNVKKYYLNLKKHNEELLYLRKNREHADIFEADEIEEFIKNSIQNIETLPKNITQEKPMLKDTDKRLRFRLHSPVALNLYDENGNHTGLVNAGSQDPDLFISEEQIPNSYYMEFGETKYAGTGDSAANIVLTGEDLGMFTFEIDEMAGDQVAENTTFANIPIMKDMLATLSVSENVSEMKIDIDRDGQTDAIFHPGEEIKKADLLGIFEKIIHSLDVEKTVKDHLINKIDNAKKQIEKGNSISANAMLENVKQQIETFSREQTPEKFRLSKEEAKKLVGIIDQIQAME